MRPSSSGAKQRALAGLHRFLLMFAYLLVIATLFQLHEYLVLRQHGIPYTRFGFAIVKSLVLAKVMLLGDEMKLGRRLFARPLIYRIIGRSALFALLFITFDFLEQIVRDVVTGKNIMGNISDPGGSALGSCIVAAIMFVMLVPYFAFVEIGRVLGRQEVVGLLFSERTVRRPEEKPLAPGHLA